MPPNLCPLALSREREIASVAESLALQHFPDGRVEPEEIARQVGVQFCYTTFPEDIDGLLVHEDGTFLIACNERRVRRGTPRSRFTFSHELAHFILPLHREAVVAGQFVARGAGPTLGLDQRLEHEADVFAANLLMPEASFRKRVAQLKAPGLHHVRSLATDFGTSLTSAAYRIIGLDLFPTPAAIFFWNQLGVCTDRRISPNSRLLLDPHHNAVMRPPASSVTSLSVQRLRGGLHAGFTDAVTWFPRTQSSPLARLKLKEEVMSLGMYGWVTLLQPVPG